MCVNFLLLSGRTYSLTSTPNDRFLRNFFMAGFFYSQSLCHKSAERKSPKKYFSYFIFDDWPGIWTQALASNKPTHYILDHGNFIRQYTYLINPDALVRIASLLLTPPMTSSCSNFIDKFKVDTERQICLRNSELLPKICWKRKSSKEIFFHFVRALKLEP